MKKDYVFITIIVCMILVGVTIFCVNKHRSEAPTVDVNHDFEEYSADLSNYDFITDGLDMGCDLLIDGETVKLSEVLIYRQMPEYFRTSDDGFLYIVQKQDSNAYYIVKYDDDKLVGILMDEYVEQIGASEDDVDVWMGGDDSENEINQE